ncbi:ABC transporter substrate-binding protein [Roseateles oligotrophus]|uniref:ABC transporter substrate-binding protein n=1 Tax=Roseateles oligotrophus TaxID=1769250 RepID=A0ABT2YKW7_9BURK|nr:ABC transporter substrate-binding protein [Roseateles oligotrophus]MCV2370703.1 ABC transporter substrate-binding protein [Roseateles oligotrophus]
MRAKQRRAFLTRAAAMAGACWLHAPAQAATAGRKKVLRTAFATAEVGFDLPQVSDQTSVVVASNIFEPLLSYDYLARPAVLIPLTAAGLPEVSADFKHFVFTLRPGIFFADDGAFKGRKRELVAEDYVYSIKRYYDPRIKTEHLYQFETAKVLGLSELRNEALKSKQPFNYDKPAAGLRALDRYRFEVRLAEPDPRFPHLFANANYSAAVAREVIEAYGDDISAHPVGTGPFRLKSWRRSSQIVLERNPNFREQVFESLGAAAGHTQAEEVGRYLTGKKLPLLDEVHISIITESQPRWLAFAGGDLDLVEMPTAVARLAVPNGRLAPNLKKQGVQVFQSHGSDITFSYFNLEDAQVGGYSPERVALRRAIVLAYDNAEETRLVYQGQALPAQSMLPSLIYGHEADLRSEAGQPDLARAQALLDLYGYDKRDAEGYRLHPDGSALRLRRAGGETARERQIQELWKKRMDAVGLRMEFETATFGELIKKALAGQLMIWGYVWDLGSPDGDFLLGMGYGPNAGQSNDARFQLAAFDRLYERQRLLPDGPERLALMHQATRLMLAYLPYHPHNYPIRIDMSSARVRGFLRHPFTRDRWRYLDMDEK